MTNETDLTNAIDDLLEITSKGNLLSRNSKTIERAFEGYIFSLCRRAVLNLGGKATLTGIRTGANPKIIILRGGPGYMWSDKQDFCFIDCIVNGMKFEIHLDVQYQGASGANHELDISIYSKTGADKSRSKKVFPKLNKDLIAGMECKFYTSTPGVSLARTFVGLLTDSTRGKKYYAFVSNQGTSGIKKFLNRNRHVSFFTEMTPLNYQTEDRFLKNLEQFIDEWCN
ncbi:hypothetical protein [Planomicrobium sp. MB-3u-38]|uniref:hypothetical protein n=1 Tax=Planomicrobium sp. MB-3u-38 TaxID=2058318 RepID=UPI000C7C3026|nr:hypothetical protein [Planomicrobium sp. MB-3u-38]PKH10330.1 hypothetical protein CXF70_10295 [Planomicrobium sp. MB-3u-38]